ncbi:MAG TPA: hypothetical protein DDX14_03055 [Cyanobacteria bacterium UBA9579]|nr:hypothetical protein [Cyanobacteria bacterium UBA9579]
MTVFEKNGRWNFRFQIKGKEYFRAVPEATTKRDAEKAEARLKSDLLQGKYDLAENMGEILFDNLANEFIKYAEVNRISWKRSDAHIIKTLKAFFNNRKLREITPFLVEKYRLSRIKEEKANSTINKEVRLMRRMFNLAIDNGWTNINPCTSKKVKPLREENKKERFFSFEEEQRLLSACYGSNAFLKPIIITALQTGMRKEEILSLKWSNVDLKNGYVTLLKTKNGKKRNIPISSLLMNELKELHENRLTEYVFTNPFTKERNRDIRGVYETACKRAKIDDLRFHDLRHTAATRMVSAGIDLVVIQEILGHADIKSTMVYSHPVPERKKQAIEALANFSKQNNKVVSLVG